MKGGCVFFFHKPTTSIRGIKWVGAIAVHPVFRNPALSLTQVTYPAFSLPYSSFHLSLRWLAELETHGDWLL